jgi:hypothetical protein
MVITGVIALLVRYTVLAERSQLDLYAPMADGPVAPPAMLQPVLAGHAAPTYGYGMTRTDQVPVQPSSGFATHAGVQYAPTATQPAASQYEQPITRSTPIPQAQDDLPRHHDVPGQSNAIPLVIRPLDLPTTRELLFPLNLPSEPNDAR